MKLSEVKEQDLNTTPAKDWHEEVDRDFCSFSPDTREAIIDLIQRTLDQQSAHLVERIEKFDHNDNHICRFNDEPQRCECYHGGIETALKLISDQAIDIVKDNNK